MSFTVGNLRRVVRDASGLDTSLEVVLVARVSVTFEIVSETFKCFRLPLG